jgi:hypothetical protein
MSQFIYQTTGKQRPAPVVGETVHFNLANGTGKIYFTDRADVFQCGQNIQWMPLDGTEGFIAGAKFLKVHLEEITDPTTVLPIATLHINPASGDAERCFGLLAQMRGGMHAMSRDLRSIAAMI